MRRIDRYTYTINTITPIHIGNGNTLHPNIDYIIKDNMFVALDIDRVIDKLLDKGIEIDIDRLDISSLDIDEVKVYSILYSSARNVEVYPFIKDNMHKVYIPGTSIKGSIRNAIAYSLLKGNKDKYTNSAKKVLLDISRYKVDNRRDKVKKAIRHIGNKVIDEPLFRGNKGMLYDIMKQVWVYDSDRYEAEEMLEVYDIELLVMRDNDTMNELAAIECINDNRELRGEMSFVVYDKLRDEGLSCIDADTIISCCKEFTNAIINFERDYAMNADSDLVKFYNELEDINDDLKDNESLLRIGWGSGYPSVTVSTLLYEDDIMKIISVISNISIIKKPVSRKVISKDSIYPLGWVKFRLDKL